MAKDSEITTVYWTSARYFPDNGESWGLLYSEPKKVLNVLRHSKSKDPNQETSTFFSCPANKEAFNNVYGVYCEVDDHITLPESFTYFNKNIPPEVLAQVTG